MLDEPQRQDLRERLTELHELLDASEGIDGATKQSLKIVAEDIHRVMEAEASARDAGYWVQVREQWRKGAWDFEAQHPRLAQTVNQITNLLANIGV